MDRALDFGSRGCGFKSCRVRQSLNRLSLSLYALFVDNQEVKE
jgi:hypothetical protein